MALQRFDIKSVRYDRLSESVLFNGRNCVVEITHGALECIAKRSMAPEEAVGAAVGEVKRLTRLASMLPADDGKIHITANIVMTNGVFGADTES